MMLKFLSRVTGRVGRCVSRSRFKGSRRVKSSFLGKLILVTLSEIQIGYANERSYIKKEPEVNSLGK